MQLRRVVITGLGVLAPNGIGKEAFWEACLAGQSGVRTLTQLALDDLPTRFAGVVEDFDPVVAGLTADDCLHLDRGTQFALVAAQAALADARLQIDALSEQERAEIGVYLGMAMAGAEMGERFWSDLTRQGAISLTEASSPELPSPLLLSYMPAAVVAARYQLGGPCLHIATGCSAGGDAIGEAYCLIQEGRAERMMAGGTDSLMSRFGLTLFNAMHALSTRNAEPERASRPYDAGRDGFVLAEGAAFVLLEERELALARGAHIYAEILAFASNNNAHHMAILPREGEPLQRLLRQVLGEAQIRPEQLGYINSHGSSTLLNDRTETFAYKQVFGALGYDIPISATKSLIGHTQGAASAIEVLVTALALDRQILPPTINQEQVDPECDLDYVPNYARPVPHQPLALCSDTFQRLWWCE